MTTLTNIKYRSSVLNKLTFVSTKNYHVGNIICNKTFQYKENISV